MEVSITVLMFIKNILTAAYMREWREKEYRWLLRNSGSQDLSNGTDGEKE